MDSGGQRLLGRRLNEGRLERPIQYDPSFLPGSFFRFPNSIFLVCLYAHRPTYSKARYIKNDAATWHTGWDPLSLLIMDSDICTVGYSVWTYNIYKWALGDIL